MNVLNLEAAEMESERLDLDRSTELCRSLEEGNILLFLEAPFEFPPQDRQFLLGLKQSDRRYHKNIAYRPAGGRISGVSRLRAQEQTRLQAIMRDYSQRVTRFLDRLLVPYREGRRLDYASFRPAQERGRNLRVRARNDLLHVDAFPTRPTAGDRILRVFTNINPEEPRRWITTSHFHALVDKFAEPAGMEATVRRRQSLGGRFRRQFVRLAAALGLPVVDRSPYDELMLGFHHFLKENASFQETCTKQQIQFPPGSTWLVYTDLVAHAAVSGQFALEQTFILSRHSMVLPEKAPLRILERKLGVDLVP